MVPLLSTVAINFSSFEKFNYKILSLCVYYLDYEFYPDSNIQKISSPCEWPDINVFPFGENSIQFTF